jgi:hypothetical protein
VTAKPTAADVQRAIDQVWSLMEAQCVMQWKANLAQLRTHAPQLAGRENAALLERLGAMLTGAFVKAASEVFEDEMRDAFVRGARRGIGG